MSGHSKWASIKHKKAIVDSRRGAAFTKLARAITVAARDGGGDPDTNASLENAVAKAKAASMPKDNIERAIAKGTGAGGDAETLESIVYEGYGPAGVALMVETVTDNRNRTGADVKHLFTKFGGSLGEPGSVGYLFDKKGVILVDAARYTEDDLMSAIEAGAEDISEEEGTFEVLTPLAAFAAVRRALEQDGVELESAELVYRPSSLVAIQHEGQVGKLMRLIDALEDNDDVGAVYANYDIPAEMLERVAGSSEADLAGAAVPRGPGPVAGPPRPPVGILCGGRGTRLQEHTRELPKPLVEIGGLPILWHVIQLYAAQGFERFLLATGYRGDLIERFAAACHWPAGVEVHCIDTGLDTPTGGRVHMLGPHLGGERFCLTYADGLADIDLGALLSFHDAHSALATMTVVRPELQFGVTELEGDGRVLGFREKPRSEHWINGGFFCMEASALDYVEPNSVLERRPLEHLARDGQLHAYKHHGFWECMDTYKDAIALNDLWATGAPPWGLSAVVPM